MSKVSDTFIKEEVERMAKEQASEFLKWFGIKDPEFNHFKGVYSITPEQVLSIKNSLRNELNALPEAWEALKKKREWAKWKEDHPNSALYFED